MTQYFKPVIAVPGISAPSGNPSYNTDNVDRAIRALGTIGGTPPGPSHPLVWIRAKKLPTNGSSFTAGLVDRFGNAIASGIYASSIVKNASDANFNGQASVDLSPLNGLGSSENSPFQMGPAFGFNGYQAGMTASFTVVASVRWSVSPAGGVGNLFGSSDGLWGYFDGSGDFIFRPDGTHSTQVNGLLTMGAATVIWYSWDNAAQILRVGKNSATTLQQSSNAGVYSPSPTGKINPFGYTGINQGNCFAGQFEGMVVLNKPYMNGAVPADDQLFANLITTWAALV